MEQIPENKEQFNAEELVAQNKNKYTPRPIGHLILAWGLIVVVLAIFIGTCLWMANSGMN